MSTVKVDIVNGSRGMKGKNRAGDDVWLSLDRTALVYGVSGTGYDRLEAAVNAVIASDATLAVDGAHPSIADLYVNSLSPDARAADVVKVRIAYVHREPDDGSTSVTISSSLRQVAANTDRDGNVLTLSYNAWEGASHTVTADAATDILTSADNHDLSEGDAIRFSTADTLPAPLAADTTYYATIWTATTFSAALTPAQAKSIDNIDITDAGVGARTLHTVNDNVAVLTTDDEVATKLRFRRTEIGNPEYFVAQSDSFVGLCNNGPWVGVDEAVEAREYKCTMLDAHSADGTTTHEVNYEFERRRREVGKHDKILYYVDPKTSRPPTDVDDFDPDLDSGNGWKRAIMKHEVDFAELGLSTADLV